MKMLNSFAAWIARLEAGLEAVLFAAATGVVGAGLIAVVVRFGLDLA